MSQPEAVSLGHSLFTLLGPELGLRACLFSIKTSRAAEVWDCQLLIHNEIVPQWESFTLSIQQLHCVTILEIKMTASVIINVIIL